MIADVMGSNIVMELIDADAHNYPASMQDLTPYLSQRWQAYVQQSGMGVPGASMYPKVFSRGAAGCVAAEWQSTGQRSAVCLSAAIG